MNIDNKQRLIDRKFDEIFAELQALHITKPIADAILQTTNMFMDRLKPNELQGLIYALNNALDLKIMDKVI